MPADLQMEDTNLQSSSITYGDLAQFRRLSLVENGHVSNASNGSGSCFCSVPYDSGCLRRNEPVNTNDPEDHVKLICSNSVCNQGGWAHKVCFNHWETGLLSHLRVCGRARSWSEKQRIQNLWVKRGYDLIFRACECPCGRGHLKKDVKYVPTGGRDDESDSINGRLANGRNRRRSGKRRNDKSETILSLMGGGSSGFAAAVTGGPAPPIKFSPASQSAAGGGSEASVSTACPFVFNGTYPGRRLRSRNQSSSSTASTGTFSSSPLDCNDAGMIAAPIGSPPASLCPADFPPLEEEDITSRVGAVGDSAGSYRRHVLQQQHHQHFAQCQQTSGGANRQRHHSAAASVQSGPGNSTVTSPGFWPTGSEAGVGVSAAKGNIFQQRREYGCFRTLPAFKQNFYYIQMEDDSCTGNDDTKAYLLTHLTAHRAVTVNCLICHSTLPVYDHFPIIDGTFFLSPVCHKSGVALAIPWSDNPPGTLPSAPLPGHPKSKYLHAVCMGCLSDQRIVCRACQKPWLGTTLLIGSLYAYDIFASSPCCYQRLCCKSCGKIALGCGAVGEGALPYFSQYTQAITCPHCHAVDYHFIKLFDDVFAYRAMAMPTSGLIQMS